MPYRTFILAAGWALAGFLAYKVVSTEVENKVYDPFEVLGLRTVRQRMAFAEFRNIGGEA